MADESTFKRNLPPEFVHPCAPGSNWYSAGDKLTISAIVDGHVFVYWEGRESPNIQFPICIGCGVAFHTYRDTKQANETKKLQEGS